jgi:hypothetical protein
MHNVLMSRLMQAKYPTPMVGEHADIDDTMPRRLWNVIAQQQSIGRWRPDLAATSDAYAMATDLVGLHIVHEGHASRCVADGSATCLSAASVSDGLPTMFRP